MVIPWTVETGPAPLTRRLGPPWPALTGGASVWPLSSPRPPWLASQRASQAWGWRSHLLLPAASCIGSRFSGPSLSPKSPLLACLLKSEGTSRAKQKSQSPNPASPGLSRRGRSWAQAPRSLARPSASPSASFEF